MVVPLRGESRVIGTVVVANRFGDVHTFHSDDLTLLETLASHAGSLLETARLEKSLARLQDLMLEREELEAQLRHAQKMEAVGRLAGGVAHDFNNLLTVILGASHVALDALPEGHELRGLLDDVRDAGERAAALTRQLLAFSRKQILQPRVVDLAEIVDRTQAMLSRLLGEEISIATSFESNGDRVRVDPAQIEQVILNLAVNAKDAMPRGGTLTIATDAEELDAEEARQLAVEPGRYVRLAVSDTGAGMDEETQSRIFEPFYTTKDQGKGTGLGLATVYGIVEQSGGRINVVSAVDRGTTFELYFPSLLVEPGAELDRGGAGPLAGRETVLVVEDEEAVRRFVSEVFRSNGYTVLEARNGDEALTRSRSHDGDVDLVVTDVVMPGMSGPELVSQLVEERPGTRVIFMSGYPDCELGERPGLATSVPFVQKPFAPQTILARARDVLDGRSMGLLSDIYPRSATTTVQTRG
jgi:signal transduction histidine kinase